MRLCDELPLANVTIERPQVCDQTVKESFSTISILLTGYQQDANRLSLLKGSV
jgi:hypothetical protein